MAMVPAYNGDVSTVVLAPGVNEYGGGFNLKSRMKWPKLPGLRWTCCMHPVDLLN